MYFVRDMDEQERKVNSKFTKRTARIESTTESAQSKKQRDQGQNKSSTIEIETIM